MIIKVLLWVLVAFSTSSSRTTPEVVGRQYKTSGKHSCDVESSVSAAEADKRIPGSIKNCVVDDDQDAEEGVGGRLK